MNLVKEITNNAFSINFIVSNKCNYNCVYCPSNLKDGSTPLITVDEYLNFFTNLIEDNPKIMEYPLRKISFTGGEPSIYNGIEELMSFFKERQFKNVVITNGSAKEDFWVRNLKNIDILCLSFHSRYANFKHFTKIIELYKSNGKSVSLNLLMDPKYWDRAIEASEYFKQRNINISYKGVIDKSAGTHSIKFTGDYINYTEEQLDFLTSNTRLNATEDGEEKDSDVIVEYVDGTREKFDGQKLIANNLNDFNGYRCGAGTTSLVIKQDGTVGGAACNLNGARFGNLVLNKNLRVKLFENGIICNRGKKCSCVYDMRLKKILL